MKLMQISITVALVPTETQLQGPAEPNSFREASIKTISLACVSRQSFAVVASETPLFC
jgi:hypothetical protein